MSSNLACQKARKGSRHTLSKIDIFIIVVGALLMFFVVVGSIWYAMSKKRSKAVSPNLEPSMGRCQLVKYNDIRHATDDFNETNLIGRGGFGSVFKGYLRNNSVIVEVAIKVLDLNMVASWKSFAAECEALRQVKHRNLVKLITACSSLDFKNQEFVALVYEYLSNGSLADWISGKKTRENGNGLGFLERLKVVIDVASAIDYLQNDSDVSVVHCDLKPDNILLDKDMTAKVGDFGLATLLMETTTDQFSISSSHVLKGSIGYMPPEYGVGERASKAGDTYSFGVTLLELFTGRSPTHESFTNVIANNNLIAWVKSCLSPNQVMDFVHDEELFKDLQSIQNDVVIDFIFSVLKIGLKCTVERASERITIREALHDLQMVRSKMLLKKFANNVLV